MLDYTHNVFFYEPYPIGRINDVVCAGYEQMVASFPAKEEFRSTEGNKFYLNDNHAEYHDFISRYAVWREFYEYVKSREFIDSTLNFLKHKDVDLGIRKYAYLPDDSGPGKLGMLLNVLRGVKERKNRLSTKFEFSILDPNEDSVVLPHTDGQAKIVSLVITIVSPGEWDPRWGGGTDVLRLKDPSRSFSMTNAYRPSFDEVEVLRTFEFVPNQCTLFVKTWNSWHSVGAMKNGPDIPLRRSITVNIVDETA
jgi:hypothetical protein